jgi:hypothetical protein
MLAWYNKVEPTSTHSARYPRLALVAKPLLDRHRCLIAHVHTASLLNSITVGSQPLLLSSSDDGRTLGKRLFTQTSFHPLRKRGGLFHSFPNESATSFGSDSNCFTTSMTSPPFSLWRDKRGFEKVWFKRKNPEPGSGVVLPDEIGRAHLCEVRWGRAPAGHLAPVASWQRISALALAVCGPPTPSRILCQS